jgi:hypothetical protein
MTEIMTLASSLSRTVALLVSDLDANRLGKRFQQDLPYTNFTLFVKQQRVAYLIYVWR